MAIFLQLKMKSLKILDQPADVESIHAEINDLNDENLLTTEKKAVAYNESRKIVSNKILGKKQKMEYNISDFEDTDESDTQLSELDRYIALKSSALKTVMVIG